MGYSPTSDFALRKKLEFKIIDETILDLLRIAGTGLRRKTIQILTGYRYEQIDCAMTRMKRHALVKSVLVERVPISRRWFLLDEDGAIVVGHGRQVDLTDLASLEIRGNTGVQSDTCNTPSRYASHGTDG